MRLLRPLPPNLAEKFLALSRDPDLIRDDCGNFERYVGVSRQENTKSRCQQLNEILKESIAGFIEFYNFQSDGQLRVAYDWGYESGTHFQGVGYIHIKEVVTGSFTKPQEMAAA